MEPARTIIVSNRLPISVSRVEGSLRVEASTGGLEPAWQDSREARRTLDWLARGITRILTTAQATDLLASRDSRAQGARPVQLYVRARSSATTSGSATASSGRCSTT